MSGIDGYDWSPLGGKNPVPGDPDAVRNMAGQFSDLAATIGLSHRVLSGVATDLSAVWKGTASDAFQAKFPPLHGQLQTLVRAYEQAAETLTIYAQGLRSAQDAAVSALFRAGAAQEAIGLSQAQLSSQSDQVATTAAAYNNLALQPVPAGPPPSATELAYRQATENQALANYRAAQASAQATQAQLLSAQQSLADARLLCTQAVGGAQAAAEACAAGLQAVGWQGGGRHSSSMRAATLVADVTPTTRRDSGDGRTFPFGRKQLPFQKKGHGGEVTLWSQGILSNFCVLKSECFTRGGSWQPEGTAQSWAIRAATNLDRAKTSFQTGPLPGSIQWEVGAHKNRPKGDNAADLVVATPGPADTTVYQVYEVKEFGGQKTVDDTRDQLRREILALSDQGLDAVVGTGLADHHFKAAFPGQGSHGDETYAEWAAGGASTGIIWFKGTNGSDPNFPVPGAGGPEPGDELPEEIGTGVTNSPSDFDDDIDDLIDALEEILIGVGE